MGLHLSTRPRVTSLIASGVAAVFAVLLRLAKASWRTEHTDLDVIQQALDRRERLLVAFWHGKNISIFPMMEGFDACILTSRSFRGEVIASLCRHFGYHCVILGHKRGNELREKLDVILQKHRCLAVAVDGPLGPYHVAKFGLVRIASRLQLTVVPLSITAERKIVMHKRWDKMELPLPFSRVLLGVGQPFKIPAGVQPDDLKTWTDQIQKHIEKTDQMIDKL